MPWSRIQSGIEIQTSASGMPEEKESSETDVMRHDVSACRSECQVPFDSAIRTS